MLSAGSWMKFWRFCSIFSSFAVFRSCAAAGHWVPVAWLSPFLLHLVQFSLWACCSVGRNEKWLQSTWKVLQKSHEEDAGCLTTAKRRRKSRLGQDGHLGRGCVKSSDSIKVAAASRDAWKSPNLQLQRALLARDLNP